MLMIGLSKSKKFIKGIGLKINLCRVSSISLHLILEKVRNTIKVEVSLTRIGREP